MTEKRITRVLITTVAMAASLGCLSVSSAMAEPKGEYSVFKECPVHATPRISSCLVSRVEKGQITIGKQEVPIVNTQTLQGGFINNIGETTQTFVAALTPANTLSKTPQPVPGGLAGLVECDKITGSGFWEVIERGSCELLFENAVTGVNATTELSGPPSSIGLDELNILTEKETGLSLPIKVKLENPLLGDECYLGPITLALTSGKSGTLTGSPGEIGERGEGGILVLKNNRLVSSTFTAPTVTGCGEFFSFILDPIIDAKIGLPSETGNTAVLIGTVEQASRGLVEESEE
jgi:hypothetical protein